MSAHSFMTAAKSEESQNGNGYPEWHGSTPCTHHTQFADKSALYFVSMSPILTACPHDHLHPAHPPAAQRCLPLASEKRVSEDFHLAVSLFFFVSLLVSACDCCHCLQARSPYRSMSGVDPKTSIFWLLQADVDSPERLKIVDLLM